MRKKFSVIFFLGLDAVKKVNFYGFEEKDVRFLIDQRVVGSDVEWARYEVM